MKWILVAHVVPLHDFLVSLHMASCFLGMMGFSTLKIDHGPSYKQKEWLEIEISRICKMHAMQVFTQKCPTSFLRNSLILLSLEAYEFNLESSWKYLQPISFEFFHLNPLKSSKLRWKNLTFWKWPIISSLCMNFKRSYLFIP